MAGTRRKEPGLSQTALSKVIRGSRGQASGIERGEAGASLQTAIAIAEALDTSIDHLVGRVDDAKPAGEPAAEPRTQTARVRDLEEGRAEPLDPDWRDHVAIDQLDTTVGADGTVRDETVARRVKFPHPWLRRHGLRARECRIVRMTGEAMEPTIPDGSAILVDTAATDRRDGRIMVIRTGGRQAVKHVIADPEAGWLLANDNPDKAGWPTEPWPEDAVLVGEVKWLGRTFT